LPEGTEKWSRLDFDKLVANGIKKKMRIFRGRFLMYAFLEFGGKGER
jgi:hypothetical protein